MTTPDPAARYRSNLQGEVDSATLYRALSKTETNPQLAEVYSRLAAVEESHAEFWRGRLRHAGAAPGTPSAGLRTRTLALLARWLGPEAILPIINTLERSDVAQYDNQPEAVAAGLPDMERSHARVIEIAADVETHGMAGSALAQLEGRHRTGGNALRAAVLGANDGLVSNLSLVMGVAGAEFAPRTVLVTGLAGLLAGACSMAMGEWLSVTSARELYESQIDTEAEELRVMPEEEKEELILIYQSKGLPEAQAKALAEQLMTNPKTALDTLSREELGIDPQDLGGSPWVAGGTSFLLFAIGAIFPVLPFFFMTGNAAVAASLALSAVVMFLIGAGTTLFTGRGFAVSGFRQVAIGVAAAAVTYALGSLLGVAISG